MSGLTPSDHSFRSWDGTELFYRAWRPHGATGKALILFHRGHEHSGRFQELVDLLDLDEVAVFAWDARGHGRSPGERGYAPSFGCFVKDADSFARAVSREHRIPLEQTAVMAHSVGSVIAAAWVHDYAPPIRALVLGCPAFRVKLYVPFAVPLLRLLLAVRGKAFIQSYVKARMLTHDPEQAARYAADPLITRAIAVNILLGLHDVSTRLLADAGAIRVPTLLLSSGSDWVVSVAAQRRFFEGLSSATKEMHVYPGFFHAIFNERERRMPIARAREFLIEAFKLTPTAPSLRDADRRGYTREEYERLSRPLSVLSPRGAYWGLTRTLLATVGRLSDGIRLGWRTGFDSGRSLDYVYENRPRGFTPVGRLLDRQYLGSVGWRGIRQRKVNLEALLRRAVEFTRAQGRPVRLLDIASGPGRYILDALRAMPGAPITALLRDRDPRNLDQGRALAAAMGVTSARFEQGDAFDGASLAALTPMPTVAVVSGLYELFPDNERVLASLRGLAQAMREGGVLVYTNQPWHPQVEMIARCLINRDGVPWVMRRRTQAEMDELVRAAGFEKLAMEIDEDGIFTVSLAERRRPA